MTAFFASISPSLFVICRFPDVWLLDSGNGQTISSSRRARAMIEKDLTSNVT